MINNHSRTHEHKNHELINEGKQATITLLFTDKIQEQVHVTAQQTGYSVPVDCQTISMK